MRHSEKTDSRKQEEHHAEKIEVEFSTIDGIVPDLHLALGKGEQKGKDVRCKKIQRLKLSFAHLPGCPPYTKMTAALIILCEVFLSWEWVDNDCHPPQFLAPSSPCSLQVI